MLPQSQLVCIQSLSFMKVYFLTLFYIMIFSWLLPKQTKLRRQKEVFLKTTLKWNNT